MFLSVFVVNAILIVGTNPLIIESSKCGSLLPLLVPCCFWSHSFADLVLGPLCSDNYRAREWMVLMFCILSWHSLYLSLFLVVIICGFWWTSTSYDFSSLKVIVDSLALVSIITNLFQYVLQHPEIILYPYFLWLWLLIFQLWYQILFYICTSPYNSS